MTRRRQLLVLSILAAITVAGAVVLVLTTPTVAGEPLSRAELHVPLGQMQTGEFRPLWRWLLGDSVFAVAYTVLFSWGLRWLANAAPSTTLMELGRGLSWVTGFAIVFDLSENLILWTGAAVAAPNVSPLLSSLVYLKFLSLLLFVAYLVLLGAARFQHRRATRAAA